MVEVSTSAVVELASLLATLVVVEGSRLVVVDSTAPLVVESSAVVVDSS